MPLTVDVIWLWEFLAGGEEEELAGHTQMDGESTAVGGDYGEVLAVPEEGVDGAAVEELGFEVGFGICGRGVDNIGAGEDYVANGGTEEVWLQGALEVFDFR